MTKRLAINTFVALVFGPAIVLSSGYAITMLDEWCNVSDEEAQEQRETGQYLRQVLDDERKRIGARTLFL